MDADSADTAIGFLIRYELHKTESFSRSLGENCAEWGSFDDNKTF